MTPPTAFFLTTSAAVAFWSELTMAFNLFIAKLRQFG
jgi:hypothetical protein